MVSANMTNHTEQRLGLRQKNGIIFRLGSISWIKWQQGYAGRTIRGFRAGNHTDISFDYQHKRLNLQRFLSTILRNSKELNQLWQISVVLNK